MVKFEKKLSSAAAEKMTPLEITRFYHPDYNPGVQTKHRIINTPEEARIKNNIRQKRYNARHPDRIKISREKYRSSHPDYAKNYYAAHKEEYRNRYYNKVKNHVE